MGWRSLGKEIDTAQQQRSSVVASWPEESREAAKLVTEAYGDAGEVTGSQVIWHDPGPWNRIVATKVFF